MNETSGKYLLQGNRRRTLCRRRVAPHSGGVAIARQGGISLVEILIGLAIVGVIATVALPKLITLLAEARLTAVENDLVTQLRRARYEAVKQGVPVTLCSSSDGASCTGETDWRRGWILFVDKNQNRIVDDSSELIMKSQSIDDRVEVEATHAYLGFLPDGSMVVY